MIEETLKVSDTLQLPLIITIEKRRGSRASIGKKAVSFRIPQHLSKADREIQIEKFRQWAVKHLAKKADVIQQYLSKQYRDGEIISVRNKKFLLHIKETDTQKFRAKITQGNIHILLPQLATAAAKEKNTKTIIVKCLANFFYMEIANRLIELNNLYFKKTIKKFSLKYMNSRWGSCHAPSGTISISSRLLLAPAVVMDYVLIHELAHLVHMNHSIDFWAEVARAMPDYKTHDKWLNDNNYGADF